MYIKIIEKKANNQSLFARKQLSKLIYENYWIEYNLTFDLNRKPIFTNNIYWSISHKKWVLFLGLSKREIWIDIEIYKKRSLFFLDNFNLKEYEILWWKNWVNFYYLWTSKEAIIKFNLLDLDYMQDIKLNNCNIIEKKINNIFFDKKLFFSFNWNLYKVLSWKKQNYIYSLCY